MTFGLLIARLLLAAVFLVAGVAKLGDRAGSRSAMGGFGVPAALVPTFAWLLPVVEIAVALALLPAASSRWGALGAAALSIVFAAGIANVLARGRKADCHCFGQIQSSRVGWSTLGRDVALGIVAGFVILGSRASSQPSYVDAVAALSVAQMLGAATSVVVLVLITGAGWFMMHLLRQQGRLLLRIQGLEKDLTARGFIGLGMDDGRAGGLPVGAVAPPFEISDLLGKSVTLGDLLAPRLPLMLLFSDPECTPCGKMFPEIARWQSDYAAKITIALISGGSADENRLSAATNGIGRVLMQRQREVAESYRAWATPSAVILSADGVIETTVAQGRDEIRRLLDAALPLTLVESTAIPVSLETHENGTQLRSERVGSAGAR